MNPQETPEKQPMPSASSSSMKQRDLLEGFNPEQRKAARLAAMKTLREWTLGGHIKLAPGNSVRPLPTQPAPSSHQTSPEPGPDTASGQNAKS
jgi:hypothetical protein